MDDSNCFLCKKEFTKDNRLVTVKQGNKKKMICKRHPYPEDIVVKEE